MLKFSDVSVARSGNNPAAYTKFFARNSEIEVGLSCYTVLNNSNRAYALAAKAPTGTIITGSGRRTNVIDNTFYNHGGTADGTLTRMTGSMAFEAQTNDVYHEIIFIGPSIEPVKVSFHVTQLADSCTIVGFSQS
jgi:hypothetical protein